MHAEPVSYVGGQAQGLEWVATGLGPVTSAPPGRLNGDLELDAKAGECARPFWLIRSLVPLGLMHVEEVLTHEPDGVGRRPVCAARTPRSGASRNTCSTRATRCRASQGQRVPTSSSPGSSCRAPSAGEIPLRSPLPALRMARRAGHTTGCLTRPPVLGGTRDFVPQRTRPRRRRHSGPAVTIGLSGSRACPGRSCQKTNQCPRNCTHGCATSETLSNEHRGWPIVLDGKTFDRALSTMVIALEDLGITMLRRWSSTTGRSRSSTINRSCLASCFCGRETRRCARPGLQHVSETPTRSCAGDRRPGVAPFDAVVA